MYVYIFYYNLIGFEETKKYKLKGDVGRYQCKMALISIKNDSNTFLVTFFFIKFITLFLTYFIREPLYR